MFKLPHIIRDVLYYLCKKGKFRMTSVVSWRQHFSSYKRALASLGKFIEKKHLNELEELGLIKAFEYTYELAWNTVKDFYEYQEEAFNQGNRDALKLAFTREMIINGEIWMNMLDDITRTSQCFDEVLTKEIGNSIISNYYDEFTKLELFLDAHIKN